MKGLYFKAEDINATFNVGYSNLDNYKLLDEQIVNKVILPDMESSPVLELTTSERDNLETVYEGRIVKDTDENKLYIYKNGSWEEIDFSGVENLNDLNDVDASSPSDGQVLTWDDSNSKWVPSSAGVGDVVGGSSSTDENIVVFDGTDGKHIKDSGHNLSEYVPYSGATQDVDLGAHNLVTSGTVDGVDVSDLKDSHDAHVADNNNPHQVTFTQAVAADSGTDITASECETLTDGSNADALHTHSFPETNNVKVSSNDTTGDYLINKIVGVSGKTVVTELNDGSDEDLQISIGSDVFDKTVDDLDDVSDGATYGKVKNANLTSNDVDHTKILNVGSYSHTDIDNHIDDTSNPHDTSMVNLIDTTITSPSNYQTLVYDSSSGKWVNSNRGKVTQVLDSSGGVSISGTSEVVIGFDDELVVDDIYSHSTSSNNSRVSVTEAGLYRVTYSLNTQNNTSGWGSYEANLKAWVRKNGSDKVKYSDSYSYNYDDTYLYSTNTASFLVSLSANDYLELLAQQADSNSDSVTIAEQSWFMVERVR